MITKDSEHAISAPPHQFSSPRRHEAAPATVGAEAPTKRRSLSLRLIFAVLAVEAISAVLVILLSLGYERHTHIR